MKEFQGKVAIVTHGQQVLATPSPNVSQRMEQCLACGIEVSANQELALDAKSNGLSVRVERCDVTQPDAVREVVAESCP